MALGALSIGHEYTNRTLTLLLSLPAARRRLYLVKLGVLAPMILTLGALAFGLLLKPRALDRDLALIAAIPILSVMCGLFLAPWLTMICRSPLAGLIFAISIPGVLHLAGDIAGFAIYGPALYATRFMFAVLWWAMTGLCAVAAVSSWRMFMRLEAIDGRDPHVRLPRWLRGPAAAAAAPDVERASHPVWLLAKKELRLQQLTFVVSLIYVAEWSALWVFRQTFPESDGVPFAVITVFHSGAAALLSGSPASAEERHVGTLESQLLLPMAAWKQWCVKAGVALGVAVLLGAALPELLGSFSPSGDGKSITAGFTGTIVLISAGSLYISSLSGSGVRAVLGCAAVIAVVALALPPAFDLVSPVLIWIIDAGLTAAGQQAIRRSHELIMVAAGVGFLPLALWFGLVNHRSSEWDLRRVCRQAGCMAAWLAVAGVLLVL